MMCDSIDFTVLYKSNQSELNSANSHSITDVKLGRHGEIVKCKQCGLIYTNTTPLFDLLNDYYKNMKDPNYLDEFECKTITFSKLYDKLREFNVKQGKVLDVGCGPGIFLKLFNDRGWEVSGVEPSLWARQHARERFNIHSVVGDMDEIDKDDKYDLIVIMDTLEHLFNPKELLFKVRKLIKLDGLLYITTPDIGSLVASALGRYWWSIISSHLFYFDRETIRHLLELTGFKVINIKTYGRTFSVGYWLSRLFRYVDIRIKISRLKMPLYVNLADQMEIYSGLV